MEAIPFLSVSTFYLISVFMTVLLIDMYPFSSFCYYTILSSDIRQHGSAVYVGMVVVVCIP